MKHWLLTLTVTLALFYQQGARGQEPSSSLTVSKNADIIEKANKLHEEASRLRDQGQIEQAIAKEEEAAKLAPQYWLPHAALGFLHFGRGGPAILEASEALKTEHPPLANINLGLLLQYFHLYDQSIETFEDVLKSDPKSIPARVGLASSIIGLQAEVDKGKKMLGEAYASAPNDPVILDQIARAYLDINDYSKTKEVCLKALALSPDRQLRQKLQKLLLVAATNTSDINLAKSLKNEVTDLQPYEYAWLRGFELKNAKSATEAATTIRFAEAVNTSNEHWLAYAKILEERAQQAASADRASWLKLAKDCIQAAERIEPNNPDIRIMAAAIAEKLGEKDALKMIASGWSSIPVEESSNAIHGNDRITKADITQLAKSISKGKHGYTCHIATVEVRMPKVTCHCRYTTLRQTVKQIPGVIDVMVRSADKPGALVIFDSQKASKKSIFESERVTALRETLEVGPEKPAATIVDLGDITGQYLPTLAPPSFFAERVTLVFPSIDRKFQSIAGSGTTASQPN